MFASFNSSFGMTGGSAIFGSVLPMKANRPFIASFVFPSQDSIQQDPPSIFHALTAISQGFFPQIQFIGSF